MSAFQDFSSRCRSKQVEAVMLFTKDNGFMRIVFLNGFYTSKLCFGYHKWICVHTSDLTEISSNIDECECLNA